MVLAERVTEWVLIVVIAVCLAFFVCKLILTDWKGE
jgi:hypothetical protein